ncbi:unnamed protein product [Amoebophrya sp. A25]|nr:unnamed protein product [Amoebophrya sp. A25]|eukprot:GSA25T00013398001.1
MMLSHQNGSGNEQTTLSGTSLEQSHQLRTPLLSPVSEQQKSTADYVDKNLRDGFSPSTSCFANLSEYFRSSSTGANPADVEASTAFPAEIFSKTPVELVDEPIWLQLQSWLRAPFEVFAFGWSDLYALVFAITIGIPTVGTFAAVEANAAGFPQATSAIADQALMTALVMSTLFLFFSRFQTCANVDTVSAVLLGKLGRQTVLLLTRRRDHANATSEAGIDVGTSAPSDVADLKSGTRDAEIDDNVITAHLLCLNVVASLVFNAAMYWLGVRRVTFLLRFLPYSVLTGFIGGTGILILQSAIELVLGCKIPEYLNHLATDAQALMVDDPDNNALQRADGSASTGVDGFSLSTSTALLFCLALFVVCSRYAQDKHPLGAIFVLVAFVIACEGLFLTCGLPPRSWYLDLQGGLSSSDVAVAPAKATSETTSTATATTSFDPSVVHLAVSNPLSLLKFVFDAEHFHSDALYFPSSLLSYVAVMLLNWFLHIAACKKLVGPRREWEWKRRWFIPTFLATLADDDVEPTRTWTRYNIRPVLSGKTFNYDHEARPRPFGVASTPPKSPLSVPSSRANSKSQLSSPHRLQGFRLPTPSASPPPPHRTSGRDNSFETSLLDEFNSPSATTAKILNGEADDYSQPEERPLSRSRVPTLATIFSQEVLTSKEMVLRRERTDLSQGTPEDIRGVSGRQEKTTRTRNAGGGNSKLTCLVPTPVPASSRRGLDTVSRARRYLKPAAFDGFATPGGGSDVGSDDHDSAVNYSHMAKAMNDRQPRIESISKTRDIPIVEDLETAQSGLCNVLTSFFFAGLGACPSLQISLAVQALIAKSSSNYAHFVDRGDSGTSSKKVVDGEVDHDMDRTSAFACVVPEPAPPPSRTVTTFTGGSTNRLLKSQQQDAIRKLKMRNPGATSKTRSHVETNSLLLTRPCRPRAWPLYCVFGYGLAYILTPSFFVSFLPKFILSGLVVLVGLDIATDALWDSRERIARPEWCALLGTAAAMVYDITIGVPLGLLISLVLFVVEYANLTGVAAESDLGAMQSCVDYKVDELQLLMQNPGRVQILHLHGYLFFGSATVVVERIREKVREAKRKIDFTSPSRTDASGPPEVINIEDAVKKETYQEQESQQLPTLILDFSSVPAMDANGVFAIAEVAREPGVQLVVCGLVRRLRNALQNADAGHNYLVFETSLDHALEKCEALILLEAKRRRTEGAVMKSTSAGSSQTLQMQDPPPASRDGTGPTEEERRVAAEKREIERTICEVLIASVESQDKVGISAPRAAQRVWELALKEDFDLLFSELLEETSPRPEGRLKRPSSTSTSTSGAHSPEGVKTSAKGSHLARLLAGVSEFRVYDGGSCVYSAGTAATQLLILVEGAVEVFEGRDFYQNQTQPREQDRGLSKHLNAAGVPITSSTSVPLPYNYNRVVYCTHGAWSAWSVDP